MPPRLLPALTAAGLCAATVCLAEPLALRPGLWELTSTVNMGTFTLPPEMLAQLPPQAQATIRARMAEAAKPHVQRKCMTTASLARALEFRDHKMQDCTRDGEQSTAREFNLHAACTFNERGAPHGADMHIHIVADSAEHMTGTVNITTDAGAQGAPQKIHTDVIGVYLGADCGDLKPELGDH